jgi:predicted PolB exonuclease-like 3'-5' exonuclease
MSPYPLHTILFLDIETVSQYPAFGEMPEEGQALWQHKAESLLRDKPTLTPEDIYNRAAIYAEFGRIVCISCGIISGSGAAKKIVLKSFYGEDERIMLTEFAELLQRWAGEGHKFLCAHNGKEFDFPYLCRRLVIHHMPIPPVLDISGKKKWEVSHLDTMELWKFGDYKNYTSLNLLALVLGIPTPKDDIDGSMVNEVYWQEKNLPRIVHYCQKDVVTVAQVYLRLAGESLVKAENIDIK